METWAMAWAKRARKAETPKQPSLRLRLRAPHFYPDRAFVKLREVLSTHKKLEVKLSELERKIENHDESIQTIFEALRQLMKPPEKPGRKIGFDIKERRAAYGKRAKKG